MEKAFLPLRVLPRERMVSVRDLKVPMSQVMRMEKMLTAFTIRLKRFP